MTTLNDIFQNESYHFKNIHSFQDPCNKLRHTIVKCNSESVTRDRKTKFNIQIVIKNNARQTVGLLCCVRYMVAGLISGLSDAINSCNVWFMSFF